MAVTPPDPDVRSDILDNLSEGVYFVDRDRRITYWNKGAERLTGYSAQEVVGRRCRDGILNHIDMDGRPLCGDRCPLLQTMQDGRTRAAEMFLHHADGSRRPTSVRGAALRDDGGDVVGAVEVFTDATQLFAARDNAARLAALASTDALTGLPNRRHGEMTLAGWLDQYDRYDWPFGVLFADVDRFKRINDEFGHDVGDDTLRMVARSLEHGGRQGDVVVRWGGEEFLVLVAGADVEGLRSVADRLTMLVRSSRLTIARRPIAVTLSVGGTLVAPGDTGDGLVRRADAMLFKSKRAGGDCATLDVAADGAGAVV